MITRQDLIDDGIIDNDGRLLQNLNYDDVTGQESGVWFDYNGSVPFVSCDNFCECAIVYLEDDDEAELVELTGEEMTADEAIDDEDEWGRIKYTNDEDEAALRANPRGVLYTLTVRVNGCTSTYYFFAPEDWA